MTKCPLCETEMKKERKEIEKGVWVTVEVCPQCKDEWIDEKEHDRLVDLFKRKTFNLGGSIAVRIPKEIADALSIHEGTEVNFSLQDKKIIISKASGLIRPGLAELDDGLCVILCLITDHLKACGHSCRNR